MARVGQKKRVGRMNKGKGKGKGKNKGGGKERKEEGRRRKVGERDFGDATADASQLMVRPDGVYMGACIRHS